MCVSLTSFVLDSHLATLWESNCPFGFLLVMFPLCPVILCLCFFPFDVSYGRCGIIVSIPDHCLPFCFTPNFLAALFVPCRVRCTAIIGVFMSLVLFVLKETIKVVCKFHRKLALFKFLHLQ